MNVYSQRKTKSSRNTNFLVINQGRLNPREGKEDPDRLIRRGKTQVVVVEEGGVGAAEVVEEAGAETPVTGLRRTRIKLRGAITTGNGVMTRRWRGRDRRPRSIVVHRYDVDLDGET